MQERFVRKRKIHRLKEEKKKEMSAERFEKIQEDGNKAEYHNISNKHNHLNKVKIHASFMFL
jgi:hypothetical protein